MTPILTIGIATYNRPYDCKRLLLSLVGLLQRDPIEVIVLNDGGNNADNIESLINSINNARIKIPIKFINRIENKHIFWTRLELLEAASGYYFMFIDDDDLVDTITIHEFILDRIHQFDLQMAVGDTVRARVYNLALFKHKQKGTGGEFIDRYKYSKSKFLWSTNGTIFTLNILKHNLPRLREELEKLGTEKLNLWDDIFTAYWLMGGGDQEMVYFNSKETLNIVNYDLTNYHISSDYRDTSKKDMSNQYKMYHKIEENERPK